MLQLRGGRWDPQEQIVHIYSLTFVAMFLDKLTISYLVTVQFWMWDSFQEIVSSKPVGQSFQKIQTWIENTF